MSIETELQELKLALARVEKRAQAAEDYIAISNLQRSYGYYVDKFQWEQVADLFARDAVLETPSDDYTRLLLSCVPDVDPDWLTRLLQQRAATGDTNDAR